MIRCPQCDHFNIEGVVACERCGAILAPSDPGPAAEAPEPTSSLDVQVLSIAATGGKIAAIKWYREQTGQGLKESKDAVEALMRRYNVAPAKSGCAGMVLLAILLAGPAARLLWPA
jgi:large subunit ribosomal protein L7/L12